MKLTPLDIRQKTFNKKTLGGIDKEEVQAFLNAVSQAWEKLSDENKELRIRLEGAEREGQKLREVESSLYRTLKTAEETGQNIVDQANREAELKVKEAHLKAESMLTDAGWKARRINEEAEEEARKTFKKLSQELKELEMEYRSIENLRDNVLSELNNLAKSIEDKVAKASTKNSISLVHIQKAQQELQQRENEVLHNQEQVNPKELAALGAELSSTQLPASDTLEDIPSEEQAAEPAPLPLLQQIEEVKTSTPKTDKPEKKSTDKPEDKESGSFFDSL